MSLALLPPTTVKLIGSSQVITSVSSVIKELMENSIDSGAQHIEIKLDKHGLEKIEVKDDGCGIGRSDATLMCLPNYTSKILNFSDLDNLSSYGFRGEALSSLCNVAQVSITTKTAEDDVATCYTYDHNGQVTCSKISHIPKGTIVTVTDLFKNLPVRKQFVSSSKRAADELKRVEKVVKSLGMIHPRLRLTLVHNKFLIWQKTSVANLRQSVMQVISINIVKQLHHMLHSSDQIRTEMLVPKRDSDISSICFSNFTDAFFLFINHRPVRSKEVEKAVYQKLFEFFGVYVPANKYPVCITSLTVPSDCLDVNLEPNKNRVYFKNHDEVLDFINQCMHIYYGEGKKEEMESLSSAKVPKKRKIGEEYPVDQKKINLDDNEINIMVEEDCQSLDPFCTDSSTAQKDSQSSSGNEVFLSKSPSKPEPESSSNNVDCMFEQFCIERDKKNPDNEKSGNIHNTPVHSVSHTDSDSSSSKVYSIFFPRAVSEPTVNEKTICNNDNKNSFLKQQQNHNLDLNPIFEKENENVHIKKMVYDFERECGNSLSVNQIQIFDVNSLQNNKSLHIGDEANLATVEKEKDNGVCESGPCEREEQLTESTQEMRINSDVCSSTQSTQEMRVSSDVCSPIQSTQEMRVSSDVCSSTQSTQEMRFSSDVCSPTLSQWSKGLVFNPAGNQVQGPRLLGQRPQPDSPIVSQSLSNRSVSSQMGCKEMSAFTKFARKMRKEILEEKPDLSFTKVAQMLQAQWRNLDTDERKKYEESATMKKSPCSSLSSKQKPISAFMNNTPNIEIDINMGIIRQMTEEPMCEAAGDVRLVGQLEASPLWLYHQRNSGLSCVSVTRLLEAVRFHQHVAEFALQPRLVNENITISPSDLSDAEWQLLLSVERSSNGVVKDERLTSNGLLIEISEGDNEARVTYVPQNVSYCGVAEVREVLGKLLTHGPNASLAQCRPLNIISFIRSEVMRKCSTQEPPEQPGVVSELLSYWLNSVASQSQHCIHYQPVTQLVYST